MAATGIKRVSRVIRRPRSLPRAPDLPLVVRPLRRTLSAVSQLAAALPDLLAIALLLAAAGLLFRDAIQDGLIFYEADTSTMFYPVFATLVGALRRGELLLWSPELFSGFPLLAEGQTGVLYPPNWLAATLQPTQQGFVWLRVGHFVLALLFAYCFGRSLRLAPGPAAVLAMSFGLGSFMVGQMQHGSVLASAVWLPLVLAFTEFGLRARGLVRQRYLVLAGLALGLSALGGHMQPVVMSGGCFLGWVAFRIVFPPSTGAPRVAPSARSRRRQTRQQARKLGRSPAAAAVGLFGPIRGLGRSALGSAEGRLAPAGWHVSRAALDRLIVAVWAALLVPVLAIALAAAQLIPLHELSTESGRAGAGWSYVQATDYSLPLPNLATVVFPLFFLDGQGGGWSLWRPWEVTYYAGVVPLALAVLALMCARRPEVLFFLTLALVASLLALGPQSPFDLHARVWEWPGMNLQRAPARFTYLGVLGIAALAGLGTQVLWENLRWWPSGARTTLRPLVVWMAALVAGLAGLCWLLLGWRAWLERNPTLALSYLDEHYLSQRRDPGVVDSAEKVFAGLWQSLDLTNRHTALPLLLLAALLILIVCWNEFRRARVLWQVLLVLLAAVDLVSFAREQHPQVPMDEVADVGAAGTFLADQAGLFRIYTDPRVERPRANMLLPWQIAEARAYDPLELSRHRVLLGSATYVDNWLFDLMGIRYRVLPADQAGLPSFRQTGFNPQHPLVSGAAFNPSGREVWTVPGDEADELRVISALEGATGIADGEKVAEWILTDSRPAQMIVPMYAGRDTAESTYDDPIAARAAHQRAEVAFAFELPDPLPSGARRVNLYYQALPLSSGPPITRVEFRYTHPVGRMKVYGFGLWNRASGQIGQFYDREKYRLVFQDASVLVYENQTVFPKAFAVPEAVLADSAYGALDLMAHGAFQPRRQVVLEPSDAEDQPLEAQATPPSAQFDDRLGQPYGDVQIVDYRNEVVGVRARTDRGGYLVLADAHYPGWRAYVDGEETRVLRADYLFRAVALPPGEHLAEFRYQPRSFETGRAISLAALILAAVVLVASFVPKFRHCFYHRERLPSEHA
jgi:hypothetical protein